MPTFFSILKFARAAALAALIAVVAPAVPASAAPIAANDAEKQLAAEIAKSAKPAETAAAHRSEWSSGLVVALVSEGMAIQSKNSAGAESLFRVSEDIAARISDSRALGLAKYRHGFLLTQRGSLKDSIDLLRQALDLQTNGLRAAAGAAAGLDQFSEAAETAISLSIALKNAGLGDESVAMAASAVDLAGKAESELLLARAYSAAGSAALESGNNRQGIDYLLKALAAAEKLNNLQGQAVVLNNLGNASRRTFDLEAATGYYKRSLAIKQKIGAGSRAAGTLNNLGEVALVEERFDEAEKYFRQALDAIEGPEDGNARTDVYVNLALLASERGEYAKSIGLAEQAVGFAKKLEDNVSLAYSYLFEAGDYTELHKPEDAQKCIDKGKPLAASAGDSHLLMRYMVAQGDLYRAQGLSEQARNEYANAIREYETTRLNIGGDEATQASFTDNSNYVYTDLVSLDADEKKFAEAFHYSELSKSQVLLDDLNSGRADVARSLTADEAAKEKDILDDLSELNVKYRAASGQTRVYVGQQIDKVRFDYSTFRTGVYAAHPELALRRADPEPVSVARAAALLPDEHTALVSYSVGFKDSYVFVIRRVGGKASIRVRHLNLDSDKLAPKVMLWRTQIAGREMAFSTLAHELYGELLRPVEADLAGIDRLIVSPDGALWQIPFEALQSGTGKFVAENYEVFYVPSATVLDRMRRVSAKRTGPLSLLALGNPTGNLPDAAAEVAGIGSFYGAGHSKVLTGAAATEAALRNNAGRYSVIHIAAHGRYDDSRPLFSYLEMAPGKAGSSAADDGNLEARELMDLHLNAKLVILSGCETARGSGSGVGIAGMSWSLFIAGAPATVASLWKIDSKSTASLMTDLHKGLASGETAAKALHDAKLAMLRNPAWRHPFYWAGMIGIGAGI